MKRAKRIPGAVLAFSFVLGLMPVTASAESAFDADRAFFNGHSYQVFDEPMTWTEAQNACMAEGGYLATLTSQEESDFVNELIQSHSKYFYWIGGTDRVQEGVWEWVTGEPWSFENWIFRQPDNHSDLSGSGEDYLTLERSKQGWNDLNDQGDPSGNCQIKNSGYICEWDSGDSGAVIADTISDETVLRAKMLTVDHSLAFYQEWESPVQVMAKQLDPYSSATWYVLENLLDMYYKALKDGDTSSSHIAEVSSTELYEYLLFKLLDNQELKYLSVTEPFGLIDDVTDGKVNTKLLEKLMRSGFKAGTKITDQNKSQLKKICVAACGTDGTEDIGWLDAILIPGKTIDVFATEFVKVYALTTVSDARAQAIQTIGKNTQITPLKKAADNVYRSILQSKADTLNYCLSEGMGKSMDSLATFALNKMVDAMCQIHPASTTWKAAADTTLFAMDTIFHVDDIATDTLYILSMANVERAVLASVGQAKEAFLKNETAENAKKFIALADTLKKDLLTGCDLVIAQINHCERGDLNWHGLLDVLTMAKDKAFDFGATLKWMFGDENSSYAKLRKSVQTIKSSIQNTDLYAGSVSALVLLREVQSASPSSWAKAEIDKAIAYNILPVWMQNNYQNHITRLEFCALLQYMIEEKTGKAVYQLADERTGQFGGQLREPFHDALYIEVNNISMLGIINGIGENRFDPLGEITRQEAAVMLYRTADVLGYDTSASPADHAGVSDWAAAGVDYVTAQKIMFGTDHGFEPQGKYTKEQAILTMVRFFENVN